MSKESVSSASRIASLMGRNGQPQPLYRFDPRIELREDAGGKMPKLTGYMIRFNEPTTIRSLFEGDFIERIAPGSAKKTLAENANALRILLNHGHDPSVGEKPLARPELIEDSRGVRYDEPELFDTSYNRDLVEPLRAGQYGSSFKFMPIKETVEEEPEPSEENPRGLPERTVTEFRLFEGGPVTFPAYEGATAGVRSITDEYAASPEELTELLERAIALDPERVHTLLDPERVHTLLEAREAGEEPEPEETLPASEQAEKEHSSSAEPLAHSGSSRRRALYGVDPKPKEPNWRLRPKR